MSGMPAPAVAPHPPVIRPEVVQPRPHKRKPWRPWVLLLLIAIVILTAGYLWQRARALRSRAQSTASLTAIRTASVASGRIERTLRITGITAAANYASLV